MPDSERSPKEPIRAIDRRLFAQAIRTEMSAARATSAQEWITGAGADAVSLYERYLVPRVFEPFARRLVEAAELAPEDRVLDVGCGTGIAARIAAARPGAVGRIVGVDVAPRFLACARAVSVHQPIAWVEGDAQDLALFADGAFDVVLCQQAFQFLPDRARAAVSMRRVLRRGGRALVSVWTSFEETPGHVALTAAIAEVLGAEAADPMRRAIFGLSDGDALAAYFRDARFTEVSVHRHRLSIAYGSPEELAREFAGVMFEDEPREAIERIASLTAAALGPRAEPTASISLPMTANVAVARA
jgi:ubiquinone/menaquinone biosynthesis C-methylase UbiE